MKIITLLQIRSLSSRLPFKALLRISNIPSAILLYKRITSPRNYKTVILTSDDKSDDFLAKVLQHYNVKFSRGNLPNVKKRFLKYLEKYNDNDLIVRVTGDNIFVDRNLIKRCVNNFLKRKKA
jgi:spore coat polysaccharide biosynthesis protein SpsF (cytidylyltransferase family)